MRRVACSVLYVNSLVLHNYVVELYEHTLVNYYPLAEELAMTEWLGGSIVISNRKAYHFREILSPNDVASFTFNDMNFL